MESITFTLGEGIAMGGVAVSMVSGYFYTKTALKVMEDKLQELKFDQAEDKATIHMRIDKHRDDAMARTDKLGDAIQEIKDEMNRMEVKMEQNKTEIIQAINNK